MFPIAENNHPLSMTNHDRKFWRRVRRGFRWVALAQAFLVLVLVYAASFAQVATEQASAVDPLGVDPLAVSPLPQDTGAAGLKQMLLRLRTTARLMQTVAHPDDEDGGMLTLESRGRGATVLLLTLNRGEGGQNKVGSNLFDVLGVLRTLELTAADRYYGVEQRFTRVADFGFSKTPEETFQKWQGHDIALADMVRVIRTFRPDVLAPRFSGTSRDGHGHHQVSSILAREAFRAAADPNRFPEQIKEGLLPWQAKKLYIGNVCGFGATTCPDENYTVKLNTGVVDPLLGMSYVQFAMEGLRHQLSQGAAGWTIDPGDRFTFYKLVDSVQPPVTDKNGHEKDFFDGIDTSLPGLATRLGAEEAKVPWLRGELVAIASHIKDASQQNEKDPGSPADPLSVVLHKLDSLTDRVEQSSLNAALKEDLLQKLKEKQRQAQTALNLAMNVSLEATVVPPKGMTAGLPKEQDALTVVSPGQSFTVSVKFHNGSRNKLIVDRFWLDGPEGWVRQIDKESTVAVPAGQDRYGNFVVHVPAAAAHSGVYTRPYWHRTDPETETINTIDDERYVTLPFPPSLFQAGASYQIQRDAGVNLSLFGANRELRKATGPGIEISSAVVVPFADDKGTEQKRPVAVAPAFSVELEPGEQVIPTAGDSVCRVKVAVSSNLSGASQGTLHLQVPDGWRVEPANLPLQFHGRGEKHESEFKVFHDGMKEGRTQIHAVFDSGAESYSEGYSVVTREDLDTFYYYQPAVQRVSIVDVKVPKELKVGYVMGAGDDIPTVLEQIGMNVGLIPSEKLASADLSQYGTIVLGIRAYDTEKEVAANNKKLLDYVAAGGTLVVQYNTGVGDFNAGNFTPYPTKLSRARVSVEEAPVEILASDDSIFHYPNQITQRDFDGWVQERGLYFMDQWDDHFKPLLACHDPGESAQKGGLLRAQYGKGTYIYTGYAFFRQLPAGVPGAIRLYVNLLSAKGGSQ